MYLWFVKIAVKEKSDVTLYVKNTLRKKNRETDKARL